jgi:hypothetical protein
MNHFNWSDTFSYTDNDTKIIAVRVCNIFRSSVCVKWFHPHKKPCDDVMLEYIDGHIGYTSIKKYNNKHLTTQTVKKLNALIGYNHSKRLCNLIKISDNYIDWSHIMCYACMIGDIKFIEYTLRHGADDWDTLLSYSCKNNWIYLAQIAILKGATYCSHCNYSVINHYRFGLSNDIFNLRRISDRYSKVALLKATHECVAIVLSTHTGINLRTYCYELINYLEYHATGYVAYWAECEVGDSWTSDSVGCPTLRRIGVLKHSNPRDPRNRSFTISRVKSILYEAFYTILKNADSDDVYRYNWIFDHYYPQYDISRCGVDKFRDHEHI